VVKPARPCYPKQKAKLEVSLQILPIFFFVILDVALAWLLFKLIFGNAGEFWSAMRYSAKPDWISRLEGDGWNDSVSEFALWLFFVPLVLVVAAELNFLGFF